MKKQFWIILLFFTGFAMTSCNRDFLTNEAGNSQNEYFPNNPGTYWKYYRFDSISHSSDILCIRIKSTVLKNGKMFKVWTYENSSMVLDTSYVYTSQDSVIVMDSNILFSPKVLLLPYTLKSKWNSSGMTGDTTLVVKKEKIDNIETYLTQRRIFGIDISLKDEEWLAPYVGLVKENIKEFNLVRPRNESWILLEYSIK